MVKQTRCWQISSGLIGTDPSRAADPEERLDQTFKTIQEIVTSVQEKLVALRKDEEESDFFRRGPPPAEWINKLSIVQAQLHAAPPSSVAATESDSAEGPYYIPAPVTFEFTTKSRKLLLDLARSHEVARDTQRKQVPQCFTPVREGNSPA